MSDHPRSSSVAHRDAGWSRLKGLALPPLVMVTAMLAVSDVARARRHVLGLDSDVVGRATSRGTLQDAEFAVLPGVRFGKISEHTSRVDLDSLAPVVAVRDASVAVGEGFCTPGTRFYDGTPNVLDVAWQDEARTRVAFVRTSGSRWATPRGVRVGMTLRALEWLAGAPVTFTGFGWDYGGRLEWQEGPGSLSLDLRIGGTRSNAGANAVPDASILGDRPVRSDLPVVRRLPIVVGSLAMSWAPHYYERDCEQTATDRL